MTLAQLTGHFFEWLERESVARRVAPATVTYYRRQLRPLLALAGEVAVGELRAWHLERCKTGWHSVQAAQRLMNWAQRVQLVESNPFARVAKTAGGGRTTIMRKGEDRALRRSSFPELRAVLLALRLTLARPQEIRALRWSDLVEGPPAFARLTEFKARDRRRDGQRVRVLPIVPRLARLLARLARRRHKATDHIFLNSKGRPWTGNGLSLAVRRQRRRLELPDDVVPYTWRHTGATEACVAGVRDKLLAELLGHTSTRTTARYQHPDVGELLGALERAQRRPGRPA
jgi:integrase